MATFCPKEVKKIIESESLDGKKVSQSHTIRKIIVFTSLGIRHGFEEMHELDFNHHSKRQQNTTNGIRKIPESPKGKQNTPS